MSSGNSKKESYLKLVMSFYFAPRLRTFLTILYLVFFLYFAVFFFDNVILAFRFLWYTVTHSTLSLGLAHLLWGSVFLISLLVPFSVSVYAVILPHEIQKSHFNRPAKIALIILVTLLSIAVVVAMDSAINAIEHREPIQTFMTERGIMMKHSEF